MSDMTDTVMPDRSVGLEDGEESPVTEDLGPGEDFGPREPGGAPAVCARPGCGRPPKARTGDRGRFPRYCEEHSGPSHHSASTGTTGASGGARAGSQAARAAKGADAVAQLMVMVGTALMIRQPWDGMVIVAQASEIERELVAASEHSAPLRKMLATLGEGSAYTGLVAAVVGTALPIMAHHHMVPMDPLTAWRSTHKGQDPPEAPMAMATVFAQQRQAQAQAAAASNGAPPSG